MSKSIRGPRPLIDILGELFAGRGYSRSWARRQLEDAWNTAVGEPYCCQTWLGEVRRGVLSVTVAHSTLLEELGAFRKPELLKALRLCAPATTISDICFRVGTVALEVESPPMPALSQSPKATSARRYQFAPPLRAQLVRKRKPDRGSGY